MKSKHQKRKAYKKQFLAKTASDINVWSKNNLIFLGCILLITFISFFPVFNNTLLAWDDMSYITNNPLLPAFNLKDIFTEYVMGNYHPLTILALAIEYSLFGNDPTGYHTINLLLHLGNVVLVFYVIFQLSGNNKVAFVAALLFGVHPIHVESVAWAAELKDLLYTFFFLFSYSFYLKYLDQPNKKYYLFALLFFFLSLLSKAMAASLPVLFVLTDYFKGKTINWRSFLEKAPFFILSLIFGVVAIFAQKSADAIQEIETFNFIQRIAFASYGFLAYIIKLIFPFNFSAFYPYPEKINEGIPLQYYACILVVLVICAAIYYSLKNNKKIFFGFGFFAITIFLVLQLLPVGRAIMADRYAYIPSIGLFFLVGWLFDYMWKKKQSITVLSILGLYALFCSFKTYKQSQLWKNDMTLWNDVIDKYQNVPTLFYNRGNIYKQEGNLEAALEDLSKAIELMPTHIKALVNRGNIYRDKGMRAEALNDYNSALKLRPDFEKAYFNRGTLYLNEGKNQEAIKDLKQAISLDPDYSEANYHLGLAFTNLRDYNNAVDFYSKAIAIDNTFTFAYFQRGNAYFGQQQYNLAIADFTKAISLRPNFPEALNERAKAYYFTEKKEEACSDLKKAASMGYQPSIDIMPNLCN